jgi:hypothetical protein
VPHWDETLGALVIQLPSSVADMCTRVRMEIGGMLLPASCTNNLQLQRIEQGVMVVGLQSAKPTVAGAALLPCTVIPRALRPGLQKEAGRAQTCDLVVRTGWPLAGPGMQVPTISCVGPHES